MDFFLDIPSAHCAKQLDAEALGKVSAEMSVQLELRDRRLHVRAQDASTALSAACKLIVNMKKLGTRLNKSDMGRVCDWGTQLTEINRLHGVSIPTSSALCEADVIHAFQIFSRDRKDKDLAMREYAVWSWQHLARAKSKNCATWRE